jgi:heat-inducible transcriptional repressor
VATLNNRARKILFAAVTEYIATGNPVGSRTLARKYAIELSPASIRNVLADLEDAGYLHQPHTSAGRVPTERALRTFIEALTEFQRLSRADEDQLRQRLDAIFSAGESPRMALHEAGALLSEMAGAAAVMAASRVQRRKLAHLRFISTRPDQLLAVLVFGDGMVENRYISVERSISEGELGRIHNLLADVVEGRSLGDVRELFARRLDDDRSELDNLRRRAFDLGRRAIEELSPAIDRVVISGSARLMELPEYADADRLKKLVRALEDREHLLLLLDKTLEAGATSVYIGSETGEFGESELSLVVAPFGGGDKGVGTVGVLGPTRMDYARLMPLVDATAAAITAALKKGEH